MLKRIFQTTTLLSILITGIHGQDAAPANALRPVINSPTTTKDEAIPKGAKFYVAPIEGGYDIYISAALVKKEVPIIIVVDRQKADFEIAGVTESEKAGWAKMFFMGSANSKEEASIKIVNLKTGTVVYGYNVHKSNSVRGKQSSAEACAKHLKERIESVR